MNSLRHSLVSSLVLGAFASSVCIADGGDLKKMPKPGEIAHGKVVYVDDGECPKGEVKEVTGGSDVKGVPRKVRCVKRPSKTR
ncbi:MAG TPA: DUF6719 family protein [Burkholderiaceae bacterium]|nr:DUF6719 family protein [Burkholderiaceae bacterium]